MKIKSELFLIACFVSAFLFNTRTSFACQANLCHTGGEYQYCGWDWLCTGASGFRACKTCPTGCYCPSRAKADSVVCTGWTDLKCEDGKVKSNTGAEESNGFAGVYACPKDFPSSDSGAKSAEDCYLSCSGTKLPNKKIHCEEGYFLHYKTKECYKCEGRNNDPSLSKNAICTGGDFYPNCSNKNQGVQQCPSGSAPNSARTKCVCSGNQILKNNKCVECTGNTAPSADGTKCISASEKCSGNKILKGNFCKECDLGTKPNANHTDCVKDTSSVPAGKYLPKGKGTPVECKGRENTTYYYCPGGDYVASNSGDQGLFTCGDGEIANDNKTGCIRNVTKLMQYNENGEECWLLIADPEKFKECVLG